jgi:hypothetical protein
MIPRCSKTWPEIKAKLISLAFDGAFDHWECSTSVDSKESTEQPTKDLKMNAKQALKAEEYDKYSSEETYNLEEPRMRAVAHRPSKESNELCDVTELNQEEEIANEN